MSYYISYNTGSEVIDDIDEHGRPAEYAGYHWIGTYTDYDGCVEVGEADKQDRYIDDYNIVERHGAYAVYYKFNEKYK